MVCECCANLCYYWPAHICGTWFCETLCECLECTACEWGCFCCFFLPACTIARNAHQIARRLKREARKLRKLVMSKVHHATAIVNKGKKAVTSVINKGNKAVNGVINKGKKAVTDTTTTLTKGQHKYVKGVQDWHASATKTVRETSDEQKKRINTSNMLKHEMAAAHDHRKKLKRDAHAVLTKTMKNHNIKPHAQPNNTEKKTKNSETTRPEQTKNKPEQSSTAKKLEQAQPKPIVATATRPVATTSSEYSATNTQKKRDMFTYILDDDVLEQLKKEDDTLLNRVNDIQDPDIADKADKLRFEINQEKLQAAVEALNNGTKLDTTKKTQAKTDLANILIEELNKRLPKTGGSVYRPKGSSWVWIIIVVCIYIVVIIIIIYPALMPYTVLGIIAVGVLAYLAYSPALALTRVSTNSAPRAL